ncbi:hypothetical protein TNCV_3481901 [Trichonephila clavipes]|nr:hypothetical protein TNCV_3481901 [Trichonephila clavipes]
MRPMFCADQGTSYIDVTAVLGLIERGFIPEYDSLSDHFDPESDRAYDCSVKTNLFNTKRAHWNMFYSQCSKAENAILDSLNNCIQPDILELCVQDAQELIKSAAEKSIPLKKSGYHKVPRWSVELFCMRKQLNAARRRYQRTKNSVLREVYNFQIRIKYKFKLHESKMNSWKSVLADITVQNVWKKIYTYGMKTNFTKRLEISGIEVSSGNFTSSFEDAVLRKSFPWVTIILNIGFCVPKLIATMMPLFQEQKWTVL